MFSIIVLSLLLLLPIIVLGLNTKGKILNDNRGDYRANKQFHQNNEYIVRPSIIRQSINSQDSVNIFINSQAEILSTMRKCFHPLISKIFQDIELLFNEYNEYNISQGIAFTGLHLSLQNNKPFCNAISDTIKTIETRMSFIISTRNENPEKSKILLDQVRKMDILSRCISITHELKGTIYDISLQFKGFNSHGIKCLGNINKQALMYALIHRSNFDNEKAKRELSFW